MRTGAFAACVALAAATAFFVMQDAPRQAALVIGCAIVAVAVPCMFVARRQLGEAFSVNPHATVLVTHGFYARIPHPMYFFLDLSLLGLIIALRQPWLLIAWGAFVTVQATQSRREYRVLEAAFGDEYREYRRRTWW